MLYVLLLRRETFFRWNRCYLLGTVLAGIFLAAFADRLLAPATENDLVIINLPVVTAGFNQAAAVSKQWEYMDVLWALYLLGAAVMLIRFLAGINRLFQIAGSGTSELLPGKCRMIRSETVKTPFSFFKWIFVPLDWEQSPLSTTQQILAHERAHAEGWHSFDIVLMECLCVLFWFHPLVHWFRRSLRSVHEYLADAQASRLTDKKQYGLLLIGQSQSGMPVVFANHFFQSPLKQRLIMLMKPHSARVRTLRYGLVLPLAAFFTLLFQQAPVIAQSVKSKSNNQEQHTLNSPASGQTDGDACNQDPAYPGGMEAMMHFLATNIKYPKNADGNLQEGMVVVSFTVKEDGGLQNVYVKNPEQMPAVFNAEALRVVSMLPKWTPGKKDCKPVSTELCIPIKFKADGKPAEAATQQQGTEEALDLFDMDTPPHFMGGDAALMQYLIDHIQYPATAKQQKAEGIAVVQFTVEKDGSISEVESVGKSDTHPDILLEAKRVVTSMPKWVPGVLDGNTVRARFTLPIKFKLD